MSHTQSIQTLYRRKKGIFGMLNFLKPLRNFSFHLN